MNWFSLCSKVTVQSPFCVYNATKSYFFLMAIFFQKYLELIYFKIFKFASISESTLLLRISIYTVLWWTSCYSNYFNITLSRFRCELKAFITTFDGPFIDVNKTCIRQTEIKIFWNISFGHDISRNMLHPKVTNNNNDIAFTGGAWWRVKEYLTNIYCTLIY